MSDDEGYDVGYGKPPKSGQFKPGKSGNPKGRRKGATGLKTSIDRVFRRKVLVRVEGKPTKVPVPEALVLKLTEKALSGDNKSAELLMRFATLVSQQANSQIDPAASDGPTVEQDNDTLRQFLKMMNVEFPEEEGGSDDED